MLMATAAPSLVLGLFAGVFVDRFDRQRIMISSDLLRALLVFSIPFLVPLNILWLYAIVLLESCVTTFFDPAQSSVLPEVASDEELAASNSLMAISSFGSTAIGFAASGLIASQFPIEWAFYTDAVTFLFSALCIALLQLPLLKPEGETSIACVLRNMQSGAQFLRRTPILFSAFLLMPFVGISFGLWNSLLLPFARQALGANEFQYGLQEGLTSIGFVVGSLLMARYADRLREGQWVTLSLVTMGVVGAIYATLTSIPLAILMVMISGLANAPYAVARNVLVQRNTPREMRGRVTSTFFVLRDVAFLIGMATVGLADVVGVRAMVLASSLLVLVPGVLAIFLPGLGQPATEWKRALQLLRTAATAPTIAGGRPATVSDFDLLAGLFPMLSTWPARERKSLIAQSCIVQAAPGTSVVRYGEEGDAVYFILKGQLVAGMAAPGGVYRSLETMRAGDFFGEIAALMDSQRTANVVAEQPTTLFQIPAPVFRRLMENSQLSQLVHRKFFERMARTNIGELPRFAAMDQQALRELRVASAS
jgi:MFS family permease